MGMDIRSFLYKLGKAYPWILFHTASSIALGATVFSTESRNTFIAS